jgi:hypothetical protein
MHLNVAPPAPSSQNPNVSPTLDAIVLKMLAKNPDERFADMGELQAALKSSGGSMFVVRGSVPSSPDLRGKSAAQPAVSTNPKLRDTTFSTGVGERVDAEGVGQKKGKGKAVGVFFVAAALAGAGVFIFRDGEKIGIQHEQAATPAAPAPKVVPPPPVAPVAPVSPVLPVAPAKPTAPKTVTVHVESDPPGANVVDEASGGKLGVTPLVLKRTKGGALKLRLEKDGYTPNAHALALDDDQTIELTLEHKPAKPAHVHKPHPPASGDSEPAKL